MLLFHALVSGSSHQLNPPFSAEQVLINSSLTEFLPIHLLMHLASSTYAISHFQSPFSDLQLDHVIQPINNFYTPAVCQAWYSLLAKQGQVKPQPSTAYCLVGNTEAKIKKSDTQQNYNWTCKITGGHAFHQN